MTLPRRIAATLGLGIVAFLALLFVGTQVSGCLGPLGRTYVQSLADGCAPLYTSPVTLVWPVLLVMAVLIWFSARDADLRLAILGVVLGAVIGVASYASLRATSLTGPISTGEIITVILPFDWVVAATSAVFGGSIGWVLAISLQRLRRRDAGR